MALFISVLFCATTKLDLVSNSQNLNVVLDTKHVMYKSFLQFSKLYFAQSFNAFSFITYNTSWSPVNSSKNILLATLTVARQE